MLNAHRFPEGLQPILLSCIPLRLQSPRQIPLVREQEIAII